VEAAVATFRAECLLNGCLSESLSTIEFSR
jgi:hypothetical protein